MIRVGIVGFGTIGKRLADAVRAQPDMTVAGVAKRSPGHAAMLANRRGYPLYAADGTDRFAEADLAFEGEVDELVRASDVVVDTTPSGVGAENRPRYERLETPALYQGGEDADVAESSFVASANYDAARDADSVRVVSCNTTGLTRLISPLDERFGVDGAEVTLVRRGADPADSGRGPIDDIVPDPVAVPSHHAPDLGTVLPDVDVTTMAMKVPATVMHVHAVRLDLEREATAEAVRDVLASESRVAVIPGAASIEGCAGLRELGRDVGRTRGDLWENCVWDESIAVEGRTLYCYQAIHQESIVVPENVDAVRAVAGSTDAATSIARTNDALGLGLDLDDRKVPA